MSASRYRPVSTEGSYFFFYFLLVTEERAYFWILHMLFIEMYSFLYTHLLYIKEHLFRFALGFPDLDLIISGLPGLKYLIEGTILFVKGLSLFLHWVLFCKSLIYGRFCKNIYSVKVQLLDVNFDYFSQDTSSWILLMFPSGVCNSSQ